MSVTGWTTIDVLTGSRTTVVRLGGGWRTHEFWAVTGPARDGTWAIQRAGRQGLGTSYDPPLPEHKGFKTKKAAMAYKKENLRG